MQTPTTSRKIMNIAWFANCFSFLNLYKVVTHILILRIFMLKSYKVINQICFNLHYLKNRVVWNKNVRIARVSSADQPLIEPNQSEWGEFEATWCHRWWLWFNETVNKMKRGKMFSLKFGSEKFKTLFTLRLAEYFFFNNNNESL